MSALEQHPLDPQNRRQAERLRVDGVISVIFGRGEGVLIDLSRRGARIRHHAPVRRGTTVRLSFAWNGARFSANTEVLASRMVAIGNGPSYESRVRFTNVEPDSDAVLASALEELSRRSMRRWVANMRGWNAEPPAAPLATGAFIRCRLNGAWWERKCTTDTTQPEEGFLIPSDTAESEIATLCDTYSRATDEERHVIRLIAAAAVEQAIATSASRRR